MRLGHVLRFIQLAIGLQPSGTAVHHVASAVTQAGKIYGQLAQAETVMSMLKRNLGGHLRCRTPMGREMDMLFKVVVHELMIV